MKDLFRRLALGVLTWALKRDPKRSARFLAWTFAWGFFGYFAGRSGFGTALWLTKGDRSLLAFFHTYVCWAGAVLFPAFRYTNGLVVDFLKKRGLNPFVFALCALPLYVVAVVVALLAVGLWTFPFYALWQVAVLVAFAARPLLTRAVTSVRGARAADTAAAIVRQLAKTQPR